LEHQQRNSDATGNKKGFRFGKNIKKAFNKVIGAKKKNFENEELDEDRSEEFKVESQASRFQAGHGHYLPSLFEFSF
jgi:hypothetical protein